MRHLWLPSVIFQCAVAISTAYAARPDAAIASQMRRVAPGTEGVKVLARTEVSSELDLVVVLGSPKNLPTNESDFAWWGGERALGLFLQRRDQPGTIYQITTAKGRGDCAVRVERATATDTVLSCRAEKGNVHGHNYTFRYDLRSKSLVSKSDYQPVSFPRLLVLNGIAVVVGSDLHQLVALKFDRATPRMFSILDGETGRRWAEHVRTSVDQLGVGPESEQQLIVLPKPPQPLWFGPGKHFVLDRSGGAPARIPVIREATAKRTKEYPLPQSTYEDFARLRPQRVKDGYTKAASEIGELLGPAQTEGDNLWFAKTFSDSEGSTGVGGFGYFDTVAKTFLIFSPPEIRDWAVSAMLVEQDAIWFALETHGEWGDSSGGLLRWNRKTEKATKIDLPDLVFAMTRVNGTLLLTTDSGAAVIDNDRARRFFIDHSSDGKLLVSEAVTGQ